MLRHKGKVILSGYDTRLYDSRLKGWHREETESRSQSGSRKREALWMNFEPTRQVRMEDIWGGWDENRDT